MRPQPLPAKSDAFYAVLAALFAAVLAQGGCASTATTTTAPSTTAKCGVTTTANPSTLPAGGGTGSIAIATERECQWTASTDGGWLKITAGTSGQGPGTVAFSASPNGDPSPRTAAIVVNDQRVELSQTAAACDFSLSQASYTMPGDGGSDRVDVRASSGQCAWTASSEADWIAIASGASGTGSGSVAFTVAPSTAGARTGTLKIAGLTLTVTQSNGCSFTIAPTTYTVGSAGGSTPIAVTAGGGCAWQAASHAAWITVSPASGSGSGTVTVTAAPAAGPARTGTATIAGQTLTVTQSDGCAVALSPTSAAVAAAGGATTIGVNAAAGCSWSAASNAGWIAIASGASGSGAGTVGLAVAANGGGARAGTVSVSGQVFTVTQAGAAACSYSLAPSSQNVPAGGGSGSFGLTAGEGCAWTAAANADWITVAPSTGAGSATLQFTAAPNPGAARSGTIAVAGLMFTVTQDAAASCSFDLKPASVDMSKDGGKGSVSVQTSDACAWAAQSTVPWITVTGGASGSGNGSVKFDVAKNPPHGDARTGTIVIGTETFTVTQKRG